MQRLVSSIEDRKVTLIQQLKFQDCSVNEPTPNEESKSDLYPGKTILLTCRFYYRSEFKQVKFFKFNKVVVIDQKRR